MAGGTIATTPGPSSATQDTVTFLFTDIEGSTRLLQAVGDGYGDLLEAHRRLLRAAFTAHGGEEVDTQGDSFFVAFATPSHAVAAAVEAQRALAAHPWPEGRPVRVRMGLHTGEATAVGRGFVGMEVHRGARIAAAAHGGQVLVSETTAALARGSLPAEVALRDLGEHRLKDLDRPERLFQLDVAGLPSAFPPPRTFRSLAPVPAQLGTFVGREREIDAVVRLLDEGVRLVTLTGPGGIGKTRLALEVASAVQPRFADGVVVVMLASLRDPSLVALAVRQALGITETAGRDHAEAVAEYLRDRHVLLVLDNFEQVVDAAPVVADLLHGTERLQVLVTSRQVLRLSGEHAFEVPPLVLPGPGRHDDGRHSEAVRLFVDRAQAARADFVLTDDVAPVVAEIARRLDGLPLAIELAAARVRLMPPETLLRRLDDRLGLLTSGPRDAPDRHRTLRATIAWSYGLLDEAERTLLERLAVFSGGAALDAVEAVCDDHAGGDVLDGLASLVDKSLLRPREPAGGEPRVAMLESLREFALERLVEHQDADDVRRRHAAFFLGLGERAAPHLLSSEQGAWIARLTAEADNLRAAMSWYGEHEGAEEVVRAAWAIWPLWWQKGRMVEGARWMEEALRDPRLPPARRAEATTVLGLMAFGWGDYQRAAVTLREAEERCATEGNAFGQGMALALTGVIDAVLGDVAGGEAALAAASAAFSSVGHRWGLAFADYTLGRVLLLAHRVGEARDVLDRGVEVAREVGEQQLLALVLLNLGWAQVLGGEIEAAGATLRESLALMHRVENPLDAARALDALAAVAAASGDPERGATLFGAAEGARRAIGAGVWVPDRSSHDRTDAALRAALAPDVFAARFEEGTRLDVAGALAVAHGA